MSLFLETICLKNRQLLHLSYHQARMDRTLEHFHGDKAKRINLKNEIQIPSTLNATTFKCRVEYDTDIHKIEFIPYSIRSIESFECVEDPGIDYRFKRSDRRALNTLKASSNHDEIIIIRQGMVTDSSYSNLVFFDGQYWYTPDQPLLAGSCRARLLEEEIIKPRLMYVNELKQYQQFKLINAMMDWDETPIYNINKIDTSRFTLSK